jgi:hypothetical protein
MEDYMNKLTVAITFLIVFSQTLLAAENLEPESIEISKKIITINQEAMRAPASVVEESATEEETLTDAMEKVEEPKLWFNP